MAIVSLTYEPNKFGIKDLLYRTDLNKVFANSGTFDVPVYVNINQGAPPGAHTHPTTDIISGTFVDVRIPNLATSKITSGVFSVPRGGTGKSSIAAGKVLVGNGTDVPTTETLVTTKSASKSAQQVSNSTSFEEVTSLSVTLANRSGGSCMIVASCTGSGGASSSYVEFELRDDGASIQETNRVIGHLDTGANGMWAAQHTMALNGSVIKIYMRISNGVNQVVGEEFKIDVIEIGGT